MLNSFHKLKFQIWMFMLKYLHRKTPRHRNGSEGFISFHCFVPVLQTALVRVIVICAISSALRRSSSQSSFAGVGNCHKGRRRQCPRHTDGHLPPSCILQAALQFSEERTAGVQKSRRNCFESAAGRSPNFAPHRKISV